jgi:hypothetical protein
MYPAFDTGVSHSILAQERMPKGKGLGDDGFAWADATPAGLPRRLSVTFGSQSETVAPLPATGCTPLHA